jgi:hypothetical protein
MGQKSFFPPNNWCCPILPLLHSMHEATNYWRRQCAACDRFSQEALSSAQPPLIEPSSWKGLFFRVLALLERCEFVSFLGFVNNNDCAAEILTMTARGGGEGEEIFGGGDNHATREDDETTTKATPQSLGK